MAPTSHQISVGILIIIKLLHCNADEMVCGGLYTGSTTTDYDINYYDIRLATAYDVIIINTCDSFYDTYVYFETAAGLDIAECDDCGMC